MKKIKLFLLGCILAMTSHSVFAQNGLDFDGTDDYVQTTYSGILGTANRTFEAWVYVNSSAPASNLAIVDYGLNAVGSRNTFVVKGDRGINFTSGGTNANISSAAGLIVDNQWTHVAFVLNNGTGFLYVNGVQVGTGSLTTVNTPSGNADLRIGQRVAGGSIIFDGKIDEVRIWNVAKTPQELLANMNSEICGIPSGLTAYYKLNEGIAGGTNTTVTTALDEVAGANGTLLNFALTGTITSNWTTGATLAPAAITNNLTLNECAGFSITVGSNTYNITGIFSDTLVGAAINGCDSIVNTDLTISPIITTNQIFTECAGFSITVGSNTYNTTGNYSDTLVAATINGCDSIVNTNLTVAAAIDLTITTTSPTLTANQTGASYQWLDCDSNFTVISGATNQGFTATANGNYAVEITLGNCVDTSACEAITSVGINELTKKTVSIFPNPATNNIQVDLGTSVDVLNYSLISITGKLIKESRQVNTSAISIDISNEAKGIYFLKLNNIAYKVIKE